MELFSFYGSRLRNSSHIALGSIVVRQTRRYVHESSQNLNVKRKACSITDAIQVVTTNFCIEDRSTLTAEHSLAQFCTRHGAVLVVITYKYDVWLVICEFGQDQFYHVDTLYLPNNIL